MTDTNHFTADVARSYDDLHGGDQGPMFTAMIEVLERLAHGGPALEFAIGTGRVALPLAARGVPVSGIELSEPMVAELRKKETGAAMPVTLGDMTNTRIPGAFSLVYLVYNTIDNLTSQDAQIACFGNAFEHLSPGGAFVVETLVPPVQRLPFGSTQLAFARSDTHWGIDEIDTVSQTYFSHHIYMSGDEVSRLSVPFRYAWPAELDVMAKCAGFVRESRWQDWDMSPFMHLSTRHVSIWRKPDL
jgi:hypothetical protein